MHVSKSVALVTLLGYAFVMKSIFISGGASGIGRAVAEKFLAEGWLVGVYDIAPQREETGPRSTRQGNPNVRTGYLDVTDPAAWEAALADFAEFTGGTIDVVDNNAGIIAAGRLDEISSEEIKRQVDINATGLTFGARAAYPYLKKTPGAQLVNMSSASAIYGQPEIATYSATKFYVAGLTEALGLEWRKDDIRTVAIWPLWAKTKLADNNASSVRRLGVCITPEQVADAVWGAVHPSNPWQRYRTHYGVSTFDRLLYFLATFAPDRLARFLTRVLVG